MSPDLVRSAVWAAAFLVGMGVYGSRADAGRGRFALGLFCGALCAHLGWGLVHLRGVVEHPHWLLQPGAASVLFFPLGVLLVSPRREAVAALPLTLATLRLGCLPYTCCYETPAHAAFELTALLLLHAFAARSPLQAVPVVLSGLGLIRLLSTPLRTPLHPEPTIDPAWFAGLWVAAGLLVATVDGNRAGARNEVRESGP